MSITLIFNNLFPDALPNKLTERKQVFEAKEVEQYCSALTTIYDPAGLGLPIENEKDDLEQDGKEYPEFKVTKVSGVVVVPHPLSQVEKVAFREKELLTQSVSELAIPIPFLGLKVDTNDIWVFVGPLSLILLLVLTFVARTDQNNIDLAASFAKSDEELALIEATCVLGRSTPNTTPLSAEDRRMLIKYEVDWKDVSGFHLITGILTWLPIFNACELFYLDFLNKEGAIYTNPILEGTISNYPPIIDTFHGGAWLWAGAELLLEAVTLSLVIWAGFIMRAAFRSLKEKVDEIRRIVGQRDFKPEKYIRRG